MQHLLPLGEYQKDWVAVAERFLGAPYLWGGKTLLGIDCSGLVQVSLASAGIASPRDSDMQEAALGEAVPLDAGLPQLRRGDLLFWKAHVGMMLDAEKLLHANAHHMAVTIEPVAATIERILRRLGPLTAVRRIR
jgi:cell wall-associated NlpC family hydrolase